MELFLFFLIHFSFLGYVNFFRRKFRIHWTNVVFFGACALALFMMLVGMLHLPMKIAVYAVFFGGILLDFLAVFRNEKTKVALPFLPLKSFGKRFFVLWKKENWSLPSKSKLFTLFLRPEYLFMATFVFGGFLALTRYKVELGLGDVWSAWYNQYYYIVTHGCWADSGYNNYASAYTMILNGVAYYFSAILHNYGTQTWCFAHYWFAIMCLMPIFTYIKWRRSLFPAVLLLGTGVLIYRIYRENLPLLFYVAWSMVGIYWCIKICSEKNIRRQLVNSILLFLGMLLAFYLMALPMSLLTYPLDTNLGCIFAGSVFCFSQGLFFSRTLTRYNYFLLLPLMVLPLIKPTGMIPAILLNLAIIPWEIGKFCKNFSQIRQHQKTLRSIFSILVILVAPVVSYKVWNYYAKYQGLVYQHKIPVGEMLSQAKKQIESGCSEKELSSWHKRIQTMSRITPNLLPQKEKSWIEKQMELRCKEYFTQHPALDFDQTLAEPSVWTSHVGIISFLVLIISIFILSFISSKIAYSYLICWGIISYFIFVFNQYYFAPMFTDIPGLFRYFYPIYAVVLAICFCGVFHLFMNRKIFCGIFITVISALSIAPQFLCKIADPFENYNDLSQSETGYAMLAYLNADCAKTTHLANPWMEGCIIYSHNFLSGKVNMPLHLSQEIKNPLMIIVGNSTRSSIWKYPEKTASGIYVASGDQATHQLTLTPIFSNYDAVALLNKTYHFSDPESWTRPPWVEHGLFDQTDQKNWIVSANAKNYFTERRQSIKIAPREKSCMAYHDAKFFFFSQDKVRVTGKARKEIPFHLGVLIFAKENTNDKSPLQYTKQFKQFNVKWTERNSDEKSFCAEFDFSELKLDKLALYYQLAFIFAPEAEGEISDLHLQQYVSGKLNLKPVIQAYESKTSQPRAQ